MGRTERLGASLELGVLPVVKALAGVAGCRASGCPLERFEGGGEAGKDGIDSVLPWACVESVWNYDVQREGGFGYLDQRKHVLREMLLRHRWQSPRRVTGETRHKPL